MTVHWNQSKIHMFWRKSITFLTLRNCTMTHMSAQNFTRLKLSSLLNLEPFNVNWLKIWQTWSTNQTPCTVLPPISVIFCKFSRNLERKALHLYSTIFSVYYRRIFSWVSQFLDGRETLRWCQREKRQHSIYQPSMASWEVAPCGYASAPWPLCCIFYMCKEVSMFTRHSTKIIWECTQGKDIKLSKQATFSTFGAKKNEEK